MIDRGRLERRTGELSRIAGRGTAVSRLGLSPDEQRARELVSSWLAPRGAQVRRDAAANLFARLPGEGEAVLVGSHLDSVPEGGRFDGALGVLCAVEAVESLLDAKVKLRRPIEVAAFGRLARGVGDRRDHDGTSIADALRALGERGDPSTARRDPKELAAYLELHIEQGPRLETARVPLGIVSAIVGIYHARVVVHGRADHAGATVMTARADALAAASEIVLAVERIARSRLDSVGTVGEIAVRPGAKNVVPGECVFSLDLRAARDHDGLVREVLDTVTQIADTRGVAASVDELARVPVTSLDSKIREVLRRATKSVGIDAPELVSGAGHDAQNPALSGVPTGMIFVRSTGGSHTPREFASLDDAALGAQALANAIRELAT
ncbi:MAG: hypothetical protein AUH39_03965 [Chloroflexi bacterium 13_1_40CM_67_9]|nr:MAG: hypothetical protein AUH39_03965 [Chloroflexi bacterium 13_1_40CM_67_9]